MTKLRECAHRQNRAASLFCIAQCWLNGWDGISINRGFFERLFGYERLRGRRLEWISEDLKEFFPYHRPECPTPYFYSVTISRLPFENNPNIGEFKEWEHPNKEYLAKYCEGFIPLFADSARDDERLLALYLSWLAQGQIPTQLTPSVKKEQFCSVGR